jgi:hypothetical protein
MNYRFNGTDYTEDEMTQVADVKGYTLEELISKNPKIETITDEEEDEGVKVEKPTPVESAPTATEIKGNGVSKPENTSSVLEENKKVEPIKVEEKPKIENVIYPEADNTKDMKKAFKDEYGVKYENIQKAVDRDVLKAEQNFQAELDKYFVDGIDKYKKVSEDGTELLNLNALEQDAYNKAVTKYKNNIDAINKKYSKERLNDYVKRYNSFLDDESKKQIDQLLIDQEKSKQDLIDFEDKIYYRYDKSGKLLGIHNYASIYDTYVAPDRLSYEEYVKIPGNENKTKKEYKNTSYALPKYDSVEDYLEDYNKHGKRSGYMQEASTSTLLDEFEIVVPSKETDTDKRLDYWKKTFSGPTEAIFNDFDDNTVARILNNLLPKSFDVNAYDPLQNRIAVTNTKNDEVEYFDVFADGNKAKARSESMRLASWLAANTINEEVKLTEDNKKSLDDYLTSLQSKPAYDNEGNLTGDGLNVDNLKIPKTNNYSIGQVSDLENFSVDLFKFANKTTPAYIDVQPGRRFSYDVAEDNLDDSRYRKSQQAAFNTFIQTPGSDGKSIGISGKINYSTMPTYEQDIQRGGFGRSDKKLDTYTEIPSTYVGGEMASQKDKDIIEYSKQNKEALFYYNKSNGEKVLFDTKKWSQENNGKNFTEFISRKAVNDVLVPEELVEEEKIVFEKAIGMDFLGDADLNKQAKIILASLNVKQDIKNNITSNKYVQKKLENKIQNFKGYSVETTQAILNIPGYEVKIRPGEDLVEVPTNYGEKVIAPKRIFDNAKAEITEFTATTELYKKNNASQLKLIDDADNANDKWEIYKLNYSDTEANLQNFVLSTADFISSSLYGGYKYLTPYGWAMSALSAGANVKDPLTEVMLGFKEYQEKQRSYYVAPPKFGEFRTAADFGSWFFNMAGTQIPQYATMLFSGGSASIPLLIMGSSAAGSTDLDFRREVIAGNKDYNEFGILWRSALSGGSEALFAGLPTWKIMNKGKSLVSGLGGNATSQFFKGGRDYLRAQVPGIIKDVTLDSGFEVINGVVQNVLAERPLTEGLGEIAATSILMTGPVSVLSPTYYALTTKDFIGGNIKQRINENTYKISEIENQNKIYSKSIQKFMDAATRLAGTSDGRYARQKVQELKTKLLENLNIKMELQTEVTSDYNSLDNTFKNKGVNPAGSANYNFMLSKLIELKNQAKQVNQNNNLTDSQKSKQLDDINAQYVRIDQAKEKYLDPKTYGDAWHALKGAGVFNFAAKKQYKEYVNKATENLLESGVTNENLTTEKVEQEARKLYHEKIAEDQIVKDQKVNPNLRVARTLEEAKDIINKSTTLGEEQKKNLISKLEKGTQNGFSIDEFEFAYTPNMVKNSMFHTGGHETSHRSSSILISKNPQAFKGFADQLVSFMEADHAELLEYAKQVNGNLFKDGKYDSEEVIATFIELVGAGKIKMNKNGNMPALLGFLFNKSLNNASEGEYNIPFNGQDDIVNWFIGLGKGLTDGSVTIGQYTELLAGALDIDLETGKVVKMTPEQTSKLAASEVEISDSETTLLDAINNLLPKDIDTKEKYDDFIRDERKAKPIVDALNKPGGAINNYIRSKQVSPEEGNEMIQNTLFRLFNFNPEETRADGSVVGPESFGERIFADTRFASLDARKKLAKEAEKKKQEARIDDEEARQVAARDDSEPTETAKDRVTPKSKIPKEFPEVFDQDIKDEFETAGLEIYESDLPDMSKKEFKAAVLDIFKGKLGKKVKDKLGTRKNYEFVVKKMAPKMKDLLPVQWFVRLEAQTKPEDRLFTNPPKRLTKKADIDKALLDEKVYVENLKQGVNIYEFKDFKAKQLSDYLLAPAINPITGEKSGLRGTRKTALVEGITEKLGRDVSPSTAKASGRTTREIAEISKKLQVDPRIKFSASYISNFLKEINVDYLRGYNSKGDVNKKDVKRFKEVLLKFYPFSTSTINSGTFANISSGKAKGQNFNDIDRLSMQLLLNFGEQGDVDNIYIPTKNAEEISIISKKYNGEVDGAVVKININKLNKDQLQELLKKYLKRSTKEFSLSEDKMNSVADTFKSLSSAWLNLNKNIKNFHNDSKYIKERKSNYDGLGFIIEEFDRVYTEAKGEDKKLVLQMLAGIFSTASANSSHMFRMAAFPSGYTSTYLDGSGTRKEHVIPQADLADFVFTVISDPSLNTNLAIELIKDNFLQLYISENQDNMLKDPGFQSKMPEGYWESWYDAIRTGDLSKAWDFESRYFHPDVNKQKQPNNTSGFNPFETYVLGESIASKYKLDNLLDNKQKKNPEVIAFTQDLIYNLATKQINTKEAQKELYYFVKKINGSSLASNKKSAANTTEVLISNSEVSDVNKFNNTNQLIDESRKLDKALKIANALNQPIKKIRVFDFDDTLAISNNVVIANKDGKTIRLDAEDFAKRGLELREDGWDMDFSDFNKVTDGTKGPLFKVAQVIKNARGNEDLFVLTARAPESRDAIYEFLKAEGLEFKIENIIGLGSSTGEAKADWLVGKAAEGYNDFYFADDAYQNVKAVKKAMSVLDVKSKVQQARVKNSETLSDEFNNLLEETTGVEAFKEYSAAKAKTIGASKGKFKFFIPYSAEDFVGLIYPTLAKGSIGDAQMAWYKQNLLDPYTRAQENLSTARINLMQDFKQLKKSLDVPADLRKKNESGFTNEQAVRVFLFDQMGYEVPGLSKRDLKELKDIVIKDPKLSVFADQILTITKGDGYAKPSENWLTGTITTDLIDLINTEKRSKYLTDWQQKVDAIYSKENLNKLEALYGAKYREALEGILSRMKSGRNRLNTGNRLSNRILDYINGSVGTIMFFNTRSALLQTISSINYLNWNFNNPLKAGAAFANQPQYWKDFKMLINSDYLRDRRNGLKLNISESEIADAAATSRNKAKAALNYILQKGYLPTQFADSFAIAAGGATFYRNRVNDLVKQGVELKQAEEQALIEWRQVSEESQQSADPSRISAQQSSNLGRLILAFANTPMQYARIQKRAIQDLINKRGDAKTNISKVIYYGVVQNIIFNALQQAAFAIGFGDDVDDEVKEKKYLNVANGMLDSLLRGIGIGGQAISVGKNFLMDVYERSQRDRPEYVDSVWELTRFSPPINSKISRLKQAAWHFDNKKRRQKIFDEGFSLDNPAYEAASKVISATTNVPLDRVLYKMENIEAALDEDNDVWQRIAMLGGWPKWQLETEKKKKSSTKKKKNIGGIKIKKKKIKIK